MARYDYKCTNEACEKVFEVEKPIKEFERSEYCPICNTVAVRAYLRPNPIKI